MLLARRAAPTGIYRGNAVTGVGRRPCDGDVGAEEPEDSDADDADADVLAGEGPDDHGDNGDGDVHAEQQHLLIVLAEMLDREFLQPVGREVDELPADRDDG